MSIVPVRVILPNQLVVVHQELNHGGTITFSQLQFIDPPSNPATSEQDQDDVIAIPCPSCTAVSFHPVTGGADAVQIIKLFVAAVRRRRGVTFEQAKQIVRNRLIQRGWLERWRHDDWQSETDESDLRAPRSGGRN